MLEPVALILTSIHFGFPLAYYLYARSRWYRRPWDVKVNEDYKPKVTIIIPTYNEAKYIAQKLDNIYQQDYPKELVEVIIVDSASMDGTPEIVEKWIRKHKDVTVKLIRENTRRGMVPAINFALKNVEPQGDVIIFTDADAWWPTSAIRNIVKYFADETVGAVSASILYRENSNTRASENVYRFYYNKLRIAESKRYSTPVHNGPLIAFRKKLLYKIGLLPEYTGNDDSTPASIIAFMGYRAIQIDDVTVEEPLSRNQFRRKIRRAQHLLSSFLETKQYTKRLGFYVKSPFDVIWKIEWWLHVANPWLLLAGLLFLMISLILYKSVTAIVLLGLGFALLAFKAYRMWIAQQVCLIVATIKNPLSKEIMWKK